MNERAAEHGDGQAVAVARREGRRGHSLEQDPCGGRRLSNRTQTQEFRTFGGHLHERGLPEDVDGELLHLGDGARRDLLDHAGVVDEARGRRLHEEVARIRVRRRQDGAVAAAGHGGHRRYDHEHLLIAVHLEDQAFGVHGGHGRRKGDDVVGVPHEQGDRAAVGRRGRLGTRHGRSAETHGQEQDEEGRLPHGGPPFGFRVQDGRFGFCWFVVGRLFIV